MDDIQRHAKQIAFQIRKYGYTYDQVSYLFKLARKEANLTPSRKKKNIVSSLSTEQLRYFLEAAIRQDQYVGLMIRTLFEGAFRIAEFCALECRDFDYAAHTFTVRNGKGQKSRRVVISQHLADLLNLYLSGRSVKSHHKSIQNESLFPSRLHKAYTPRAIQKKVKQIAQDANLDLRIHPHLLRHTRATLLAEKGMPLPHLQGFLGHESVTTTEHYTRTAQYNFREKLNEIEPSDPLGTNLSD